MHAELQDIVKRVTTAYSADELRILDERTVNQAKIEPIDAKFLCAVGVPRIEALPALTFNLAHSLPTLRDFVAGKRPYSPEWPQELRCLNESYDYVVGIDNARNGAVICLDLSGEQEESFVNSKVRYFVGFLAECVLHHKRYRSLGVREKDSYQELRDWMLRTDSQGSASYWWQEIYEDMELYGQTK
jgi:hypothetical protein